MNTMGPDGKLVIADIIHPAPDRGQDWIDFRWPNPLIKKIEAKSARVMRDDPGTICGSGFYKG